MWMTFRIGHLRNFQRLRVERACKDWSAWEESRQNSMAAISTAWVSSPPMINRPSTTTLWRPTGPKELDLVRELNWRAWPPRLPEQPIFYPVLNEDYAVRIARDWNVKHDGAGYVTR